MTVEVEIVNADALIVGPEDTLVVVLPAQETLVDDTGAESSIPEALAEHLGQMGLRDRCLVLAADDVKLAVIQRPSYDTINDSALADLPVTKYIWPKPVYARVLAREKGETPGPPTEEEKADAIRVLERDGPLALPDMQAEALRILDEAGR